MVEKVKISILAGIFVCLAIIAQKSSVPANSPIPHIQMPEMRMPDSLSVDADSVIRLGENRIAIVDTNRKSSSYGDIVVLEYDLKTKMWQKVSSSNYNYKLSFQIK